MYTDGGYLQNTRMGMGLVWFAKSRKRRQVEILKNEVFLGD
jgi:hypothetical protein